MAFETRGTNSSTGLTNWVGFINGTCTTAVSGSVCTVTLLSGGAFSAGNAGQSIKINGSTVTVLTFVDPTHVTVPVGVGTNSSPVSCVVAGNVPSASDWDAIGHDLRTLGGNVDGAGYQIVNLGGITDTSGNSFKSAGQFFDQTVATNLTFTPASTPNSGSWVFLNGIKQQYGSSRDFTVSGGSVLFNSTVTIQIGDVVEIIQ